MRFLSNVLLLTVFVTMSTIVFAGQFKVYPGAKVDKKATEEAQQLINLFDHVCDPAAKEDFCETIGITEDYFDEIVDRHANRELVEKRDNEWRLRNGI